MDIIQFCSDIVGKIRFGLNAQDCKDGIDEICRFFGIATPVLIEDMTYNQGETCVINGNPETTEDDILIYNLKQLREMGVTDKISFMLVMTHECAHRAFQNDWFPGPDLGQWEKELCSDFFMGVKAGLEGWNITNVLNALSRTPGCGTHPKGSLRRDYMLKGESAAYFNRIKGRSASINDYLKIVIDSLINDRQLHQAELNVY